MKLFFAFAALALVVASFAGSGPAVGRSFEVRDGQFWLNGKPFQIIGGEMHMSRVPRAYWRHRLKMARAMGLNTIGLYLFWNVHETEKGKFDFKGENDVAEFCRTAAQEGLWVCLRPGPYVCAEWDFGGMPYWLLTEPNCVARSNNGPFLEYSARWMREMGKRLAPLQANRGGNIIMVQVENEYGSYGKDKAYMAAIRDQIRAAGFTVPLYTADGATQMPNGSIDGVLPGNNGADSPQLTEAIKKFAPAGPFFCPEWYPGWLCHWGEKFPRSNTDADVKALEAYLRNGHSINLYMWHGGTNFGFWNGANYGGKFEPHITSYDYDAPLDEAGRPTDEYRRMRAAIMAHVGAATVPEIPRQNPIISIARFGLNPAGSVLEFADRQESVTARNPMPMENLGQGYGFTLYRTTLSGPRKGTLKVKDVRDFAVVTLDGKPQGTLDRRRKENSLELDLSSGVHSLEILVENGGRINYGGELLNNLKGITQGVWLDGEELTGWKMTRLPFKSAPTPSGGFSVVGPTFYRGSFDVSRAGDTWLDMRGWTKGVVWVNGHNLGRYWWIGPQQTLYVPGPWLRSGRNEIVVLELVSTRGANIAGLNAPILDDPRSEPPIAARTPRPKLATAPAPVGADIVGLGSFKDQPGAQDVSLEARKGRYVALRIHSALDGSNYATCAELILLGSDGKALPRAKWKVLYADSEEVDAEDGRAENMIDDDPATIWHTEWSKTQPRHPHMVVIDLGSSELITGARYVPRSGTAPGRSKGYAFYVSEQPFGAKKA